MSLPRERCGLKGCENPLGPGAADVGYRNPLGDIENVRVCSEHAWMLMTAQPGDYRITEDKELKAIPRRMFFT